MKTTRGTVVKSEMGQLDMSLKQYKADRGEYPPDGASTGMSGGGFNFDADGNGIPDEFEKHFARVFPRASLDAELTALGYNDLAKRQALFLTYNSTTSMVFWLGGMPENVNNKNSRLLGFSQNPVQPLSDWTSQRSKPYFEFDPARLAAVPGQTFFRTYSPSGTAGVQNPPYTYPNITCYVYFRAEGTRGTEYFYAPNHLKTCPPFYNMSYNNAPIVRPYWDEQSQAWVNAQEFQILFCGFDGKFGVSNVYKSRKVLPSSAIPAQWITRKVLIEDPPGNNDGFDDQANFGGATVVD
jgi:hypothetical protein